MARGRPLLTAHSHAHQFATTPSGDVVLVRDWTTLEPGQLVVVHEDSATEMRGRVDEVAEDGKVLWLHLEGGRGRRLITRPGGDRVWRLEDDAMPEWPQV